MNINFKKWINYIAFLWRNQKDFCILNSRAQQTAFAPGFSLTTKKSIKFCSMYFCWRKKKSYNHLLISGCLKTVGGGTTQCSITHKVPEIFSCPAWHKYWGVISGLRRRVLPWCCPFSDQTICHPQSGLTFRHPVRVNAGCVATWAMLQRPFDFCTFFDTAWTWKQSTPHCTCGVFQRPCGRQHMVNYSFIFPLAAFAIRQGFACIITDFDMDEAPLRFVYYRFFLWIMLHDFGLLCLQSDA